MKWIDIVPYKIIKLKPVSGKTDSGAILKIFQPSCLYRLQYTVKISDSP